MPTCATPALRTLLATPQWRLQIVRGAVEPDETEAIFDSVTIAHDGTVTWWRPKRPVRTTQLPLDLFARIDRLARLDCTVTPLDYHAETWYRLGDGGTRIPKHTPLGAALEYIVDTALTDYRALRLTSLDRIVAHVSATSEPAWSCDQARYQLALVGNHVTVRYGGELLYEHWIDDDELVDLVDTLLATDRDEDLGIERTLEPQRADRRIRGVLTVDDRTIPFSIGPDPSLGHGGTALWPLIYPFDNAMHVTARRATPAGTNSDRR